MTVPVSSRCYRCNMAVEDIRAHDATYHGDPPDVRRARRIVDEYECRTRGHSWDVVETFERPTHIICGRCGKTYPVAAKST